MSPRDRRAEDRDEYIIADHGRRIGRLEKRPIGGGFDPNEDPIIIGAGACGDAGFISSPSDVSAATALSSVIIGNGAFADDDYCVAVGPGATVDDGYSQSTSVGRDATCDGNQCTSIGVRAGSGDAAGGFGSTAIGATTDARGSKSFAGGWAAQSLGDFSTAVGPNATVALGKTYSTAVGYGTNVTGTHSTAIGAGSGTSKDNCVALGSAADFVEIYGNTPGTNGLVMTDSFTGVRYIIGITSGALVLNTAP